MKQYIITIIGAAVLSGLAGIISPENWRKYVRIVTGLVILSVIAAPIGGLTKINLFSDFSMQSSGVDTNTAAQTVREELEKRIEQDICERLVTEFSCESEAEVTVSLSEKNEISGVEKIVIITDGRNKDGIRKRMSEVYGVEANGVEINEP